MAKVRTQRHIDREKARKRSKSLVYKAHELGRIPIVKVYLVIERGGKIDRYKSTDQPGWPPSEEQMDKHFPIPRYIRPADLEPANGGTTYQGNHERGDGRKPTKSEFKGGSEDVVHQRRVFSVPKLPALQDIRVRGMYNTSDRSF